MRRAPPHGSAAAKGCVWMALALLSSMVLSHNAQTLTIPINVPAPRLLSPSERFIFSKPGDQLNLKLFNATAQITSYEIYGSKFPAVTWNAPVWTASTPSGTTFPFRLSGPAVILGTDTFRLRIANTLPYQASCACGCDIGGDPTYCDRCKTASVPVQPSNPFGIYNGAHNLMVTNIHTHGLKVDLGADRLDNLDVCRPLYSFSDVCSPPPAFPSGINCQIYGDNIYASVLPGGMTGRNTYFVPALVPGMHWYHHHEHGDVAYLTPTSNGPIIVPDINSRQLFAPIGSGQYEDMAGVKDWRDWDNAMAKGKTLSSFEQYKDWSPAKSGTGGSWNNALKWDIDNQKSWKDAGKKRADTCNQFIKIIEEMPNFSPETEILHLAGLWFRRRLDGTPDDDTIPFIACNALPPDPLICPLGLTGGIYNLENIDNRPGLDFVAINSVIQPTLSLTTGRWKRWMFLNTLTMKSLDITIRPLPSEGWQNEFAPPTPDCELWLLAHDGVYLETVPRFPMSSNTTRGLTANNVVLGPANRADVLIRCNKPGKYALVSGAGPFDTLPTCGAVHCEVFGGSINTPGSPSTTGNSQYKGTPLNAALLAVIEVVAPSGCDDRDVEDAQKDKGQGNDKKKCKPDPDLTENMCRTRLELFSYTDVARFPPETQDQCWNLVNLASGAGCNVNGALFGNISVVGQGLACITQGFTQDWDYRGIDFHPFHLHETPVRLQQIPFCLNNGVISTNWWKATDWFDTVFLSPCQCTPANCETTPTLFVGTGFPPVPANFGTDNTKDLERTAQTFLRAYNRLQNGNPNAGPCDDRFSVLHCHHLSHEDEGCMAVGFWKCPTSSANGGAGVCPANGMCPDLSAAAVAAMGQAMEGHHMG